MLKVMAKLNKNPVMAKETAENRGRMLFKACFFAAGSAQVRYFRYLCMVFQRLLCSIRTRISTETMKKYDFDTLVDRRGSGDVKHAALQQMYGRDDLIGLWVADMDFATPDFILDALKERLEHPVLGYTVEPEDYRPAIVDWLAARHQWKVEPEWLSFIPGIVKGIGLVVNCFLEKGDKVIIQPPVYHPFRLIPENNGYEVVFNPLTELPEGGYAMDFEQLEKICDDSCKLLVLSNPHNPAGLVWDRETLRKLALFCHEHHIMVISDEIHSDMTLYGHRHIPFATVCSEAAEISITFGAPSKTFNIPGVVSSYSVVPNPELREKFYGWLEASELAAPGLFAPIATIAAYRHGEEWRRQMLEYIEGNIDFVAEFCASELKGVKAFRPQASFLVWLDCRGLNLSHDELVDLFVNKARLALNDGEMFGPGGQGFMRLNVALPRQVLAEALKRLKAVL